MPRASRLLLAAFALSAPLPAAAERGINLAVSGGGIGAEPVAGVRLAAGIGVHGDATLLGFSHHFQSGRVQDPDYLAVRSAAVMMDLFPLGGDVRLSIGARYEGAAGGIVRATRGPAALVGWTRRLAHGLVAAVEAGALRRLDGGSAMARLGPVASARLGWRF